MKAEDVRDAIMEVLRTALQDLKNDLKKDWETKVQDIARWTASQIVKGDTAEVQRNLSHLQAQAKLVAAIIAVRERRRVQAILFQILETALQIGVRIAAAALIA